MVIRVINEEATHERFISIMNLFKNLEYSYDSVVATKTQWDVSFDEELAIKANTGYTGKVSARDIIESGLTADELLKALNNSLGAGEVFIERDIGNLFEFINSFYWGSSPEGYTHWATVASKVAP